VLRQQLNLGILAHVDAGKTTLTERLLYEAGVIAEIGSVDAGTTQTDTLALERQRGITIKSAVAAFTLGELHVNLLDTPGHPDFIAEVERVLSVLDGAVLVLSAVEGVQPQTRILFRALERLRVPMLLFVNKLDRGGADPERVIHQIHERLAPDLPYPIFVGSARTGAGVAELTTCIAEHLPPASGDAEGPVSAKVFKIERGRRGEKIAYARLFDGTIRTRDRVPLGDDRQGKVTSLAVFERGGATQQPAVAAGAVAQLWGLEDARIGDWLGVPRSGTDHHFSVPTLESVVVAEDGNRLRVALLQLAEQDPLVDVRQDGSELSVSLYGEVQKEVIQATLAAEYGVIAKFRETVPIYIERPLRAGGSLELIHSDTNPYDATVALRIAPAPEGSGVALDMAIERVTAPIHIYKTYERFVEHMQDYVTEALKSGLYGWRVTDCVVTVVQCTHAVADGPPSQRGETKAIDFRKLTPLVLRQALARAGTIVCEPVLRVRLEVPPATIGTVSAAAARLGGAPETPSLTGALAVIEAIVPAARVNDLQRQLAGLTSGEGVLDSEFAGYRPVGGKPPVRNSGN
jgi:ribosomal protection tetracycline resistance protein